jgi:hypothetical protein
MTLFIRLFIGASMLAKDCELYDGLKAGSLPTGDAGVVVTIPHRREIFPSSAAWPAVRVSAILGSNAVARFLI